MSTIYFTNANDSGDGSLRAAIASASPGDVVKPDPAIFADVDSITVLLDSYLLAPDGVSIDGENKLILDGQLSCAIMTVGALCSISNLAVQNGRRDDPYFGSGIKFAFFNGTSGARFSTLENVIIKNCGYFTPSGSKTPLYLFRNCYVKIKNVTFDSLAQWSGLISFNENPKCEIDGLHIINSPNCDGMNITSASIVSCKNLTTDVASSPFTTGTAPKLEGFKGKLTFSANSTWTIVGDVAIIGCTNPENIATTTLSGSGYLALPSSCDSYEFAEGSSTDVVRCNYGAGITALTSTQNSTTHIATATVTATDATKDFVLERAVNGVWTRLTTATSYSDELSPNEVLAVRTWDGDSWRYTYKYYQSGTTRYFYTNAAAGNGSLKATIDAAQSGDTILPSPDVFPAGETVVVYANSNFNDAKKYLTIGDGTRRIRIEDTRASGMFWTMWCGGTFNSVDFLSIAGAGTNGYLILYNGAYEFNKCRFFNTKKTGYVDTVIRSDAWGNGVPGGIPSIIFNDCIIVLNSIYLYYKTYGSCNLNRCTFIGNTHTEPTTTDSICVRSSSVNLTDVFVNPSSGTAFCSTSSAIAPNRFTPIPWDDNWDFRLKPTATDYITGATTIGTDIDGRTRLPGGCLGAVANVRRLQTAETIDVWSTDSPYIDADNVVIGTLNLAAPLSVDHSFKVGTLNLSSALNFPATAADRFVSVADSATFDDASADGCGYLMTPIGASTEGLTAASTIRLGTYSANMTTFSATAIAPKKIKLRWTASSAYRPVLERRDGENWTLLTDVPLASDSANEQTVVATAPGRSTFRAFDGVSWRVDDAWTMFGAQFSVVSMWSPAARAAQNWKVAVQMVTSESEVRVGQGITILARVTDAFDSTQTLGNDGTNIVSVKYSCYRCSNGLFEETSAPVTGHSNVSAGTDCVLEGIQTSSAWTVDANGYNFALTPDIRTNPLFDRPGEYRFKVSIELASGNPIVFYVPVSVADLE